MRGVSRWWGMIALLVVSVLVLAPVYGEGIPVSERLAPLSVDQEYELLAPGTVTFSGDTLDQEVCGEFHLNCDELEFGAVCDADASGDCHCADVVPPPGLYCRAG